MSDASRQTGTRARTRQAILDAAVAVLARDQAAPLAEIASAAGVSRTTLHRHFADRAELVSAVAADSNQAITNALAIADTAHGEPGEALRRLVAGLIEAGDRILFLFHNYSEAGDTGSDDTGTSDTATGPASDDGTGSGEEAVIALIRRGQEQGVFTTDLDATWIENALWSLVFAGCEEGRGGTAPRHVIATNVIRTLEGGIAR